LCFLVACSSVSNNVKSDVLEVKQEISPNKINEDAAASAEEGASSEEQFPESDSDGEDDLMDDDLDAELDKVSAPEIDFSAADPLEKANRLFYGVHRAVDLLIIRPIALTYSRVLPKPAQKLVSNFVSNLLSPLRTLCWLLQGNVKEAGKTVGRFVTNSFLGGAGLFDVASKLGLDAKSTSFAETFQKWGIRPGPYVVVPGVGPATLRTAVGFLFDSFADPVFLLTLNKKLPGNENHELMWVDTGVQVGGLLISRAEIDPLYEELEKTSVGRYAKLRSIVLQQGINK
jgi:phospholipid-binding lipoprotein MlaA